MLTHGLPGPKTEKSIKSSPLLLSRQCQTRLCVRIGKLSLVMLALTDPARSHDNVRYIGIEVMESAKAGCVCRARLKVTERTPQHFGVSQNPYVIEYIRSFALCMHASQ
jgi:hypothetical protein